MDRSELAGMWNEHEEYIAENNRQQELRARAAAEAEARRAEHQAERDRARQEAQAAAEAKRQAELPEIIAANKAFHARQLALVDRFASYINSDPDKISVDSVSDDERKIISSTKLSFGQVAEGLQVNAILMLFQRQRRQSVGHFALFKKLWNEPQPDHLVMRLEGVTQGFPNEFDYFVTTYNLGESKRIVEAPAEELAELRWPDPDIQADVDKMNEILDLYDREQQPAVAIEV